LIKRIEDGINKFGDNPVPKIIQQLLKEGLTAEAQTMGSIWLSYIGEPAIPHLITLLGHDNNTLAMFAAKTLAVVEGSLPHLKKALMSDDPKIRIHAAGSLQFFGANGKELIPDLCNLIKREVGDQAETIPRRITEAAGNAAGALGRMGEAALTMVGSLLESDNPNIRFVAVSALLRIGKPALPLLIEARAREKDQLVFVALQNTINKIEEVETRLEYD
jgi:HEAT repeat protein